MLLSSIPPSLLLLMLSSLAVPARSRTLPTTSAPLFPPSDPVPPPPQSSGPIPPYVLAHAPIIHLSEDELYWPSTIASHLKHTSLRFSANSSDVPKQPSSPLTHDNLGFLGNGSNIVYLESGQTDESMKRGEAPWLGSEYGIPREADGRSESEVIIVLVDKREIIGEGYLDAFYFTFYSYNEGNTLFDIRFGDHVGDWEHIMIRYLNGVPQQVFLSEHAFGEVWPFDVIGKADGLKHAKRNGWEGRPLVYSAEGSHALYGTPGKHEYLLPFGLLWDHSSPGPVWDPVQNHRAFWLNTSMSTWWTQYLSFVPVDGNDWDASFLDYAGKWGDEFWTSAGKKEVDGQYCYAGNCRYVNGPVGPRFKYLDRKILDPVDFTFDLILAICIVLLLAVMVFALAKRIRHPPPEGKPRDPSHITHLFPFCFFPALSLSPEPIKRRPPRPRAKTWYPDADERTPLL